MDGFGRSGRERVKQICPFPFLCIQDVVGQMWFRYVQLSSVAFKTTGESGAKVQECIELQKKRDIKVSNQLADSLNCSGKTTKKKQNKETMENMENIELSSDIAREDFYEGTVWHCALNKNNKKISIFYIIIK